LKTNNELIVKVGFMNISLKWLKELVDFDMTTEELDLTLTMLGIEVEGIVDYKKKYENFYTAKVLKKEKHPDADKLSLCVVECQGEQFNVVCGAPNVEAGQNVAFGKLGAVVPSAGFKLEKRKIRGYESEGMICSQNELETGEDKSGIWVLPEDAQLDIPLVDYLALDDVVFEIGITPDRADCLSHIGIARDLAAYLGKEINMPEIDVIENGPDINESGTIEILDQEKCPRYAARIIRNVEIKESDDWLKNILVKLGLRPINNVVDITNFVLMEMGQPLHAFDLNKLEGRKIIVQTAKDGEKFTTLDSQERTLDSDMLMICDGVKPIAVGGVMGGENTEVTTDTTNILLESAYFNPSSIRKTAKKLGIQSDASYRFERGVDINNIITALDRASALIAKMTGGTVDKGYIDVYPEIFVRKKATLRFNRARKLIGADISDEQMMSILHNLKFGTVRQDEGSITVKVPSWRVDVDYEVDLIEEIARMYNYDNIEPQFSTNLNFLGNDLPEHLSVPPIKEELRRFFVPRGFQEIITYNLSDPKMAEIFTENPVRIANPLGKELSVLRPSLVPSILKVMQHNIRFGTHDISLFEIGKTFHKTNKKDTFIEGFEEKEWLAVAISGLKQPKNWSEQAKEVDFYDIKGICEEVIECLRLEDVKFKDDIKDQTVFTKNALNIYAGKSAIGSMGEISKKMLDLFDIEQKVFILLFDLMELYGISRQTPKYSPVAPFPAMLRDIGFVVDRTINAVEILNLINNKGGKLLKDVKVFDVYEGKSIEKGKKSIAFSLTYSSPDRTLVEKDVEDSISKVVAAVEKKFNATLRKF
jgi:phenylalanyl-tRNA synthetase beta chain